MKIFSWLRNRGSGSEDINKPNQESMNCLEKKKKKREFHKSSNKYIKNESCKEEVSDWRNGLLAIGTFGNNTNKDMSGAEEQFEESVDVDQQTLSVEELLDCLLQPQNKAAASTRGTKDIRSDKEKRRGIAKKSLAFLINKATPGFVSSPPILRDPLSDLKLDNSRMDKILRAMLHKKIYPQRPTPKKCLDMAEIGGDEEEHEEGNHESKWVKTDSEYIVLEI